MAVLKGREMVYYSFEGGIPIIKSIDSVRQTRNSISLEHPTPSEK